MNYSEHPTLTINCRNGTEKIRPRDPQFLRQPNCTLHLRPLWPAIPPASQAAHSLDPSKDFLQTLVDPLTQTILIRARRAPVQPRPPHAMLARYMRHNTLPPTRRHKIPTMIRPICAHVLHRPRTHPAMLGAESGAASQAAPV